MKTLRFIRKLLAVLVHDRVHHPARLAAETCILVARGGIVLLLYRHVFAWSGGSINGLGYAPAAWSMFLYFAFSSLRLRELPFAVQEDVRTGNVEVLFSKPVAYLPYRMGWQLGAGLYPAAVMTLLGGGALAAGIGLPAPMRTPAFLAGLGTMVLGGIVLSLLLYALVGLLAFWIEDVSPVYWIVDKLVMILGGSYLPVALLPAVLKNFATYSPFGASQFLTRTALPGWEQESYFLIAIQWGWIAVLAGAVCLLARIARRKVSINGG